MASIQSYISDAIGLFIAVLYTIAGQAHYTSRFTPGMAATVDSMTPNTHRSLWFLGLDYETVSILPCLIFSKHRERLNETAQTRIGWIRLDGGSAVNTKEDAQGRADDGDDWLLWRAVRAIV